MHGVDGTGIAIVGHAGDLAQPRLVKIRVGDHHADRGVAGEFVLDHGIALPHVFGGGAQPVLCRVQHARDLSAGLPVIHIPQGVDDHDGADLQIADLNGIAADAGLHAILHPGKLAHGRPAPRATVAVPVIRRLHGQAGGFIAHVRVRANGCVPHGQIVDVRLRHQRHQRIARIVADAVLLQIPHHAVCRAQAVGAAAGQHDAMDALGRHQRVEQLALAAGGSAAAHIQPGAHALRRDEHRAACGGFGIFSLTDEDRPDLCHRDLTHGIASFRNRNQRQ